MKGRLIAATLVGLFVGFAFGFYIANYLNRTSPRVVRDGAAPAQQSGAANPVPSSSELSPEEITKILAEATAKPEDFEYQKSMGMALYKYAGMRQDAALLEDVAVLLERAHSLRPDDYESLLSLANVKFDLGQIRKDEASNLRARELYAKALEKDADDVAARTDLGMTYLFSQSPDVDRAVAEMNRSLEKDPRDERTLRFLAEALVIKGDRAGAEKLIATLKEVSPGNPGIQVLEAKLREAGS